MVGEVVGAGVCRTAVSAAILRQNTLRVSRARLRNQARLQETIWSGLFYVEGLDEMNPQFTEYAIEAPVYSKPKAQKKLRYGRVARRSRSTVGVIN